LLFTLWPEERYDACIPGCHQFMSGHCLARERLLLPVRHYYMGLFLYLKEKPFSGILSRIVKVLWKKGTFSFVFVSYSVSV
jgi:hypothetical protein